MARQSTASFFKLLHPNRDKFEEEGWPFDDADDAA
jgi:hypothetical protein